MSVMRKRTSQGHAFRLTEFWSKDFVLVVKANKNAKKHYQNETMGKNNYDRHLG